MAVAVALKPSEFDCDRCRERHCTPATAAPFPLWEIDGVGPMTVCPKPQITPQSDRYLSLYRHYRNGILAVSGGLLDQPNPYLESMEQIDALVK